MRRVRLDSKSSRPFFSLAGRPARFPARLTLLPRRLRHDFKPGLAETSPHRSHLSAAALLLWGFFLFVFFFRTHQCIRVAHIARACVPDIRVSLLATLKSGFRFRLDGPPLPPAVLHLSSLRRGLSGPLHIPLPIISFNLGDKKKKKTRNPSSGCCVNTSSPGSHLEMHSILFTSFQNLNRGLGGVQGEGFGGGVRGAAWHRGRGGKGKVSRLDFTPE